MLCSLLALCCGASWGFSFVSSQHFSPLLPPIRGDAGFCSCWYSHPLCDVGEGDKPFAAPKPHSSSSLLEQKGVRPRTSSPTQPFPLTWLKTPQKPLPALSPLALHLPPPRPPPQVLRGGQTPINQSSATPSRAIPYVKRCFQGAPKAGESYYEAHY